MNIFKWVAWFSYRCIVSGTPDVTSSDAILTVNALKNISKTNNIISSPAVSFDRIEITYGKFDEIILSPKDKHKFADDLLKINPDIINNL